MLLRSLVCVVCLSLPAVSVGSPVAYLEGSAGYLVLLNKFERCTGGRRDAVVLNKTSVVSYGCWSTDGKSVHLWHDGNSYTIVNSMFDVLDDAHFKPLVRL